MLQSHNADLGRAASVHSFRAHRIDIGGQRDLAALHLWVQSCMEFRVFPSQMHLCRVLMHSQQTTILMISTLQPAMLGILSHCSVVELSELGCLAAGLSLSTPSGLHRRLQADQRR